MLNDGDCPTPKKKGEITTEPSPLRGILTMQPLFINKISNIVGTTFRQLMIF